MLYIFTGRTYNLIKLYLSNFLIIYHTLPISCAVVNIVTFLLLTSGIVKILFVLRHIHIIVGELDNFWYIFYLGRQVVRGIGKTRPLDCRWSQLEARFRNRFGDRKIEYLTVFYSGTENVRRIHAKVTVLVVFRSVRR